MGNISVHEMFKKAFRRRRCELKRLDTKEAVTGCRRSICNRLCYVTTLPQQLRLVIHGEMLTSVQAVKLLTCISEVPNSILGQNIGCIDRGFHGFFRQMPVEYLKLGHQRFLPYPSQFII
jgi:hypothetical protein